MVAPSVTDLLAITPFRLAAHFSVESFLMLTCSIQDYFFDRSQLTDGAPPNDRGCRACGKIGHIVADCPRSRQKKTAESRKRENKEREQAQGGQTSEGRQCNSHQSSYNTG